MNAHLPLKTTAVTTKCALLACFRVTGLAEIVRQLDGITPELCLDTVTPAWVQDEAMDASNGCVLGLHSVSTEWHSGFQSCFPGGSCLLGGICWGNLALPKKCAFCDAKNVFPHPKKSFHPLLNILAQAVCTEAAETATSGHTWSTGRAGCNPGCSAVGPGA